MAKKSGGESAKLAAGHTITWTCRKQDVRAVGSANIPRVLIEFRGAADGMLSAVELAPEFQDALTRFQERDEFRRLESIRRRIADGEREIARQRERLALVKERFLESGDDDGGHEQAALDHLERAQTLLTARMAEDYKKAAKSLDHVLQDAGARIMADAMAARDEALANIGPTAAKWLTVLSVAESRIAAAQRARPRAETIIGEPPRRADERAAPAATVPTAAGGLPPGEIVYQSGAPMQAESFRRKESAATPQPGEVVSPFA